MNNIVANKERADPEKLAIKENVAMIE